MIHSDRKQQPKVFSIEYVGKSTCMQNATTMRDKVASILDRSTCPQIGMPNLPDTLTQSSRETHAAPLPSGQAELAAHSPPRMLAALRYLPPIREQPVYATRLTSMSHFLTSFSDVKVTVFAAPGAAIFQLLLGNLITASINWQSQGLDATKPGDKTILRGTKCMAFWKCTTCSAGGPCGKGWHLPH